MLVLTRCFSLWNNLIKSDMTRSCLSQERSSPAGDPFTSCRSLNAGEYINVNSNCEDWETSGQPLPAYQRKDFLWEFGLFSWITPIVTTHLETRYTLLGQPLSSLLSQRTSDSPTPSDWFLQELSIKHRAARSSWTSNKLITPLRSALIGLIGKLYPRGRDVISQ